MFLLLRLGVCCCAFCVNILDAFLRLTFQCLGLLGCWPGAAKWAWRVGAGGLENGAGEKFPTSRVLLIITLWRFRAVAGGGPVGAGFGGGGGAKKIRFVAHRDHMS